ncbi:transcription repressor OFP8-like [Cynara cardunculus var. scolymus]|uniref:Transcription repressor n=1 Tax=Cynara cardunculus var. scolymus TaxID=59895 RepID=A0A103YM41_CYNCS|nr:transcription repressor OFP8-like [Cynara cardunculus var. scolymus]KVI11604.1 Ovate protein family, C-terminal [Cynara cardunculus var. scolymus]
MDNRLKLKVSKMFHSCRSKDNFDVSDQPFFFPPENYHHRQLIHLFSPKPHSFIHNQKNEPKSHLLRPKTFNTTTSFPANTVCRRPEKTTKKKPHYRKPRKIQDFSSFTDNYYYDWRSSDEEDESDDGTTLFSSRSLSSESSGTFLRNRAHRKSQKKPKRISGGHGCACGCKNLETTNVTPLESSGKLVKDSFAVVKKSSNPHEDFRVSMVEMIVEKQIFGEEDLQNLLQCFISLNSEEHHRVIFEVFTEIWEALFSASV